MYANSTASKLFGTGKPGRLVVRLVDAIRSGIRALGFEDLRGIFDALDRAMAAAKSERGFHPWLPAADKARAASRALQDLGDDEL